MTAVELYRTTDTPASPATETAQVGLLEQQLRHAKALGLTGQISRIKAQLARVTGTHPVHFGYPEITAQDWRHWARFLPTVYREDALSKYTFDTIPARVFDEWTFTKSLGLFETYWIRTPEANTTDPLLIGWDADKTPYLVARWGESLHPWEQIVVARSWVTIARGLCGLVAGAGFVSVIGGLGLAIAAAISGTGGMDWTVYPAIGGALAIVAASALGMLLPTPQYATLAEAQRALAGV